MPFDFSKLSGKIVEKYGTQYNFAKAMGLSEHSLSTKLNNKVPWKANEIAKAIELLGINTSKIPEYFFDKTVQKNWTKLKRRWGEINNENNYWWHGGGMRSDREKQKR